MNSTLPKNIGTDNAKGRGGMPLFKID